MSTPNPTHIIAEALLNACGDGRFGPDDEMAAAVEDRRGMAELAAYVVSKLTDAGYSIAPSGPLVTPRQPMGRHNTPIPVTVMDSYIPSRGTRRNQTTRRIHRR